MLDIDLIWKRLFRNSKPRSRDNRARIGVELLEPRLAPAGTPYQLAFLTQPPAQIYPGEIVTPAIKVAIEDSAGNIVTTATDVIELADTGLELGGDIVESAVDGVATFANIYFANATPTDRLGADDLTELLSQYGTSNSFAVLPVPTETTVTAAPNPSTFNQTVTITATVTPLVSGLNFSPSSYVELTSGNVVLQYPSYAGNDQWVLTTSSLPIGSDSITANYQGNLNWVPSSGSTTQVVNPAPPILYNPGNQSSDQDTFVYLQLAGSDPNGGTLTYSETGLPASMSLESTTGLISGTVSAPPANYNVTVTATDSYGLSASQSFTWTVIGTNAPPTLANPGNQTNAEGDTVSLQLQGGNSNGATLSYSETGLPAALTVDPTTGLISGTVSASPGEYGVTATVTDVYGSASQSFVWTVTPAAAAQLEITAPATVMAGDPFDVTVTALDAFGNIATGYTGTVHFTSSDTAPGVELPGDYTFQPSDQGTHTFTMVVLQTAGNQTITATDTVTPSITGSSSVTVQATIYLAWITSVNASFLSVYQIPLTAGPVMPVPVSDTINDLGAPSVTVDWGDGFGTESSALPNFYDEPGNYSVDVSSIKNGQLVTTTFIASVAAEPPPVPTGGATALGEQELSWGQVPDTSSYYIYRGPTSSGTQSLTLVAQVPASQLSFVDTTAVQGAAYTYEIVANLTNGEKITLPLLPPPPDPPGTPPLVTRLPGVTQAEADTVETAAIAKDKALAKANSNIFIGIYDLVVGEKIVTVGNVRVREIIERHGVNEIKGVSTNGLGQLFSPGGYAAGLNTFKTFATAQRAPSTRTGKGTLVVRLQDGTFLSYAQDGSWGRLTVTRPRERSFVILYTTAISELGLSYPTAQGPTGGSNDIDQINDSFTTMIEMKNAMGLLSPPNLNPDGSLKVTENMWAQRNIFDKMKARLDAIQVATRTFKTPSYFGPNTLPTPQQIRTIKKVQFQITGNWPALRAAVNFWVGRLRVLFPGYTFSVTFG